MPDQFRNGRAAVVSVGDGASDDVWKRLAEFQQLDTLRAKGEFSDEGLHAVAQITSLTTLELHSPNITDDGLLVLVDRKGVRHLTIGGKLITSEGIAALGERMPDCKIGR